MRKREQRMLIDGPTLIQRAIDAGIACEEIFVDQAWLEGVDAEGIAPMEAWLQACPSTRVLALPTQLLGKIQYGDRTEQAIAVACLPDTGIERVGVRFPSREPDVFLVLDRIEKPGNLGAMFRSADAAGISGVLLSDPVCEPWNPNAIRASLGAIFSVPSAVGTAMQIQAWLEARGAQIYTARAEGGTDYAAVNYPQRMAIVVGSEAHGLDARWTGESIGAIHIPMHGRIDSLNASVSAAVLLFEAVRQLRHP